VPTNQFETTQSISKSSNLTTSATFAQALPWFGSSYRVNMSGGRSATNGFSTFNPTLSSGMTLTFSQPLWQRLKIDSNRFGVESSQRNHQIVDLQLQEQILQTQTAVRLAYLNLVGAIAGVEVAQENKRTNDQALANARARIAVGSAAEIDAIQSEAAVLSSEDAVIVAETRVATSEDVLRNLIVDVARVDFWSVHIVPTDTFRAEPKEIDIEASIKNALDNRLDLQVARRQLELTRLNQDLTRDQTKMALDMTAQYSASGTGGTQIDPNTNLPVTVGFGSVFGDAFGYKNPSWTLGLTFGYPLGQTSARVNLARQQIQIDQATIDLKTQEQNITAQVRDAARQVTSGFRRVQSTQAALAANEKQLEAEQRKLAVGMASTFDVLQRQQLLASAKNAELAARIAYNQALINFERVQRIR
jgi:outer membrane protein TolC